jgi:hypothetical protein
MENRDKSVGIVTGYGLQGTGIRFPADTRDSAPLFIVETISEAHPVLCPIDTGGSFLGGKATRVRS